jgi:hypothetical protein
MGQAKTKKKMETTRAILAKIDRAIAKADFSKIPPDKLLALRIQYMEALKGEAPPKRAKMKGGSVEEIMDAYTELLNQVREGRLTVQQATKETAILSNMVKAIETHEQKQRIEEIERILNNEP